MEENSLKNDLISAIMDLTDQECEYLLTYIRSGKNETS